VAAIGTASKKAIFTIGQAPTPRLSTSSVKPTRSRVNTTSVSPPIASSTGARASRPK
jgi:hypothetical protein